MDESNLHEYQKYGVEHVKNNPKCGLFLEMGLGKTITTLTAINYLMYEELETNSVLIIAPKRVVESVWDVEAAHWTHTRKLKFSKIIGSTKQRMQALRTQADIYLISRDNIAWLCGLYGGSMLPFDMLVIDELSSFKNPKSIRFKSLRRVLNSFSRVVGLTGTPAPNGLIDLWSQIYLLDQGERLYKHVTTFREEFFNPDKMQGHVVLKYKIQDQAEERIFERISDICMSMKAKDYLNLPDKIINVIKLRMPSDLREQYDDFEKESVLELFGEEQVISVANSAALCNKLLQFANGAVYDEDRKVHEIHNLKLDALAEILEDANGKPVLVAWAFRHDMERIKERFKKLNPVSLKNNDDIEKWNRGEIQLMMMHPASGGHGLNLQAGGHIIVWYGNSYSLELEQQFNARLYRQGQKHSVIIHKLVTEGTMDESVIEAIYFKDTNQNRLMEAVKARINKYVNR